MHTTCTCLRVSLGAHHSSEEGAKAPLGSQLPAWVLVAAFFAFFPFDTFPCFKRFKEQKLLSVSIVDVTFLTVGHGREWILMVGTCK